MKKILFSLAAMAAMVGCAKDAPIADSQITEAIAINASIDLSDTRVTVEGNEFTDVKWEQGDNVTLASVAGTKATLAATEAGDNVRFEGEGSFAADTDTFYAIYPAVEISDGVSTFDLAAQSGSDAAILAAKAASVAKGSIDMAFKPINALLHVAVDGATIAKAEFMAFDGTHLPQSFSYSFADDAVHTTGEVASYVIENPAAEGFFFSLPADIDMSAGYIVRLTDANNKVLSKAYNGKTFERGTTTRVNIAWSQPSVTLGAKTSYSYYLLDQPATANTCANNLIYFTGDCASTYAGIQNAFVSEVGFYVGSTKYSSAAGQVNWNKSTKSFSMSNVTAANGSHNVKAYIVTKEHGTIESEATLYITGLPYTLNVSANDGTWEEYKDVKWGESNAVRIGNALGSSMNTGASSITKSDFKLPTNVNVKLDGSFMSVGTGSLSSIFGRPVDSRKNTTLTLSISGSDVYSYTTTNGAEQQTHSCSNRTAVMSASNASIELHNSNSTATAATYVYSLTVGYSNK